MPAAPKDAAHAAVPRRFPLLRRVMRFYRALILTILFGLLFAIFLVPLRDPAHYLAGLQGELTLAQKVASQAPTQTAAAGVILVALFALSWLSDHAYQREVQRQSRSAAPAALTPEASIARSTGPGTHGGGEPAAR